MPKSVQFTARRRYPVALMVLGFFVAPLIGISMPAAQVVEREPTESTWRFDGPVMRASVAGYSDGATERLVGPARGMIDDVPYMITGLMIDETGDEPCAIRVFFRPLDTTNEQVAFDRETSREWRAGGCSIDDEIEWESTSSENAPADRTPDSLIDEIGSGSEQGLIGFRTRLRVASTGGIKQLATCSRDASGRFGRDRLVKGIRGLFMSLQRDGTIVTLSETAISMQPNCDESGWVASTCPDSHVPVRLGVFTEPHGQHTSIVGLQFRCRAVTYGLAVGGLDPATGVRQQ